MSIWRNKSCHFPLCQGTQEEGTPCNVKQAVWDTTGQSVCRGHPSGEMELTAGYTEAVWDGDKKWVYSEVLDYPY